MGAQIYESIEAQQEANKADKEYKEKGKKYEENPDLAKEERKKANEIFTSKKSPEELKKYKLIIEEVKKLEKDQNNLGKTQDEIYEIAEKIVEEKLKNNTEKKETKIEDRDPLKTWDEYTNKPSDFPEDDNYEFPESIEPTAKETSKEVSDILDNPKEKISQEEQNQQITEKYKNLSENTINDPKTSVMSRLVKSGELSTESNEIIEKNIETEGNFDKEFEKSITIIKDLSKIQKALKQIPKNKESIPTDNLSNFKEDFPDFSDIAINGVEAKSIKKGEEPEAAEILAYEEIAENYIKIGNAPEDKIKNYSTAIETASANILKNNKTIDRESIKFKETVNKIHGDNPKEKFEGLVSLIEIKESAETKNAAIGKKLDKRTKKPKLREKLNSKLEKLKNEYLELKEANTEGAKKRMIEIQKEGKKIQELLKEKPKSGEIIGGGNKKIEQNETGIENQNPGV